MRDVLNDQIETRDWTAYREASERLERYRLGDFSPLDDAVAETFSTDRAGDFAMVPVDVVAGACRDVGRLYDMPPTREFKAARAEVRQRVADFYAANDLDELLGTVDQMAHAQQAVVVGFDLLEQGRVRGVAWAPFEVLRVEFDDLLEEDISRARRVELRVPVSVAGDSTIYGRRVYTPDEAYTEAPGGGRVGVFNEDGTNPFGFVPLVARREAPAAAKGEWLPPINEALLKLQEQVAISVSDILRTARYQCQIRQVLTGGDGSAAQTLKQGADSVWYSPGGDDANAIRYSEHAAPPPTAEYWETVREMLEAYERFAGMTPGALTRSTGVTGAAKSFEADGNTRRVRERMGRAARFERDVLGLLLKMGAVPMVPATAGGVDVTFNIPKPAGNSLQDEQARMVRYAAGNGSPVADVMEEQGVSRERALEIVRRNKAEVSEFVDIANGVQGMDKTARPPVPDAAEDAD